MTWSRLDDQFTDHPKVVQAGPMAGWLYVCGLTYASRYLTDGFIPRAQVKRLADLPDCDDLAGRLVKVGLWEVVEGGYRIHDYLEYNRSASGVKAERDEAARRQAEWRAKKAEEKRLADSNAVTNGVTNTSGPGGVTPGAPLTSRSPVTTEEEDPAGAGARAREAPASVAAPPKIQPVPKVKPAGVSLAPVIDAFRVIGLRAPPIEGREIVAAEALLNQGTPEQIAKCWQEVAAGEVEGLGPLDRANVSFYWLQQNNRFFNWLDSKEGRNGKHAAPGARGPNGPTRPGIRHG